VVGLLQVIIAFVFKIFSAIDKASRWGKDVVQICGLHFFSHFREDSFSSQLDAIAIMSFVVSKGRFERIPISLSSF